MSITPICGANVHAHDGDVSCDELLAEWDAMDSDLGAWLCRRGGQLAWTGDQHRGASSTYAGLSVEVWRALVLIWATDPLARLRYSPESRSGLFAAAQSMDDVLLLDLVAGLVEEAFHHPEPSLAAAA